MAWGPGPTQGPLVGSRGNAPAGVQGAEPPEAPGFSGFLRPQNASPLIVFLSFLRQIFSAKSFDIVRYKIILMIRAHSLCSDIDFFIGIQRRGSGFDIRE